MNRVRSFRKLRPVVADIRRLLMNFRVERIWKRFWVFSSVRM